MDAEQRSHALRALHDTGLPAQCLSLELTESALLHSDR